MSELRCLCCGKIINIENAAKSELENQWHQKCCNSFFGKGAFPKIDISKENLEAFATETVSKGFTVAGVQKKLSLHLSKEKEQRLTIIGYPSGYILKPQTEEFEFLPELENLVMRMAETAKIKTVPNALIKLDDGPAYITKRIDRNFSGKETKPLAMEDFCQLSERLTEEKYKSSYERCAKVIKQYSSKSGLDLSEFFYRLVFCFITGNSDMHLKNFSLIESESGSRVFALSPAYDLLPVNIVLPEDKEEFALTLNGKKSNLKLTDFLTFAASCGINQAAAGKMIQKLMSYKTEFDEVINNSFLTDEYKKKMHSLVEERISRLI